MTTEEMNELRHVAACAVDLFDRVSVDPQQVVELVDEVERMRAAAPSVLGEGTDESGLWSLANWLRGQSRDALGPEARALLGEAADRVERCARAAPGAGDAGLRADLLALAKEWEDEADRRIRNAAHRPVWEAHGLKTGASFERAHAASLRALAAPPGAPALAPWYEADGSTVMLPAEEVERRRKLAAKVLALVRRFVREDEEAPGDLRWGHHIAEDGTDLGMGADAFALEVDRLLCEIDRAAPPGSETAPHSDTCVGRVHDSLGCSCGSETAPSPDAAKGAKP